MNLKLFLKKLKKNKQKYPIVKRNSSLFFKQLQKEKEIKKKVLKNYINNYFFNKKYSERDITVLLVYNTN